MQTVEFKVLAQKDKLILHQRSSQCHYRQAVQRVSLQPPEFTIRKTIAIARTGKHGECIPKKSLVVEEQRLHGWSPDTQGLHVESGQ